MIKMLKKLKKNSNNDGTVAKQKSLSISHLKSKQYNI